MRPALREELPGLLFLLGAVVFGAVYLAPELALMHVALNDDVLHLTASERLLEAFRHGEPFLDPWVSEWALGYPLWRSYQPLPHLLAAALFGATDAFVDHATAFAWLQYLLLVFWPASVYIGARALGFRPLAAGLASVLVLAPNGTGDMGRYGIEYGAFVWRGSGLYTQIAALHAFVLTLGLVARALDSGRHRALAAAALAVTALCHIVFGYTAGISALVLALVAPSKQRSERVARLVVIGGLAATLVAWFVIPLWLTRDVINHSRYESAFKWDSFGAQAILTEIASGKMLDAGRLPVLSVLMLMGLGVVVRRVREQLPRQLLALTTIWLLLFFGRATWGQLLVLFGVPADLHLHRLQGAFELCAVLATAWGLHRLFAGVAAYAWRLPLGAALAAAIALLAYDRAAYLKQSESWGNTSLKVYGLMAADVRAVIADVRALLAKTPGRASAGLAAGWGRTFKVGDTPFYGLLSRAHIDQASFLYHSMSRTSDLMVLRDESNPAHVDAFGLRVLVAPAHMQVPPHFRRYAQHGMFAVYEGTAEGYFGLVDVTGVYSGPSATKFEPGKAWLQSSLPRTRQVVALTEHPALSASLPRVPRWASLPSAPASTTCGRVTHESKNGEIHQADVTLDRDCHVFFKSTWDPYLVARVDGERVPLLEVTPGFGAIPMRAGNHRVEVRYEPGPLRPIAFVLGLLVFAVAASWIPARKRFDAFQAKLASVLTVTSTRLDDPRWKTAGALAVLSLIALRPLFRGRLINGHDATEYVPRLVEFARVLADGHIPPVWAPDLSAGYGQPLFQFAPPLVYLTALPFYAVGARSLDALQWGLALLHTAGATATYLVARHFGCSRVAAVGVATAWLFAPYTALDLFVRGAFAEASAVAVAPIAVWLLLRCLTLPSIPSVIGAGFGIALILLAHNAAALLLLPALALLVMSSAGSRTGRLASCGAIAVGLALSAYFWLPAFTEKHFVQTDLLRAGFLDWRLHAVAWSQLLFSPWGHGLSGPGLKDGMSFALGLPQLLLAAFGLWQAFRGSVRARRAAMIFGLVAFCGAWLATSSSAVVWQHVEALQYLAYPWRALMLPGLFVPLLCVWALQGLKARWQLSAIAVLVLANVAHTEPKGYLTFDEEYYAPESIAKKGLNTTTREEYRPREARVPQPYSAAKLLDRTGGLEVLQQRLSSVTQEFHVRARNVTRAEFATFAYPGWKATIDGKETRLSIVPSRATQEITIPAGEHTVRLELHPTPVRLWSAILSFVTALLAGALVVLSKTRTRHASLRNARAVDVLSDEKARAMSSGIFIGGARTAGSGSNGVAPAAESVSKKPQSKRLTGTQGARSKRARRSR
jgi:uncharacterized membrane protein